MSRSQPRTVERAEIGDPSRIRLLESDVDRVEVSLAAIHARLGKILWAMVGLLISLATTSIVILITTGVGR